MDSFEKPLEIVVDSDGNILGKRNQAKEKRQGSKFWEHQLVLIEEGIEYEERYHQRQAELKNKQDEINALVENSMKDYNKNNKTMLESIHAQLNEEYPEMAKIHKLEKQKEQQALEVDQAISQVRQEMLYKKSIQQKADYVKLKIIVSQALIQSREREKLIKK